MPLSIELKPHEKIFINGAVVLNGPDRTHFSLLNDAALLREKDILTEGRADTPCKRIYLAVQLMYMDPADATRNRKAFDQLSRQVLAAAPSAVGLIVRIADELDLGRLYLALKAARKLIEYEQELINHARQCP